MNFAHSWIIQAIRSRSSRITLFTVISLVVKELGRVVFSIQFWGPAFIDNLGIPADPEHFKVK